MDPLQYLLSLEHFGMKFGLANIRTLCTALGRPHTKYRSILIAGTNGKGSVTAMVDCALRKAGVKTGRYTSPHLIRVEERFTINGQPVATDALLAAVEHMRSVIDKLLAAGTLEASPTFFEVTTALAFELFRNAGVEFAVLEVGLGGRLDSTNIVEPVAAAVTSIDFDHEQYLGTTLKAMGEEKGLAYMRELAKQAQLRAGRTLLAQLVAAGEFKGALTAYSQTFEVLKPTGAPVDWVYLNPVFANIHPSGVAAKAPHPNAARLFVDFVLSKRGQELVRAMNRIPDRIDTPPEQARLIEGVKPAFASTEVFENIERYAKMFHDIFGGR